MRRRQGFVEPRPPAIPRLELRARQPGLDLHHAYPEVVERALIFGSRAFEMKSDLEPPRAGVMPGLVVELGMAVVELDKPRMTSAGLERLQIRRKLRLDALAQAGEELLGRHRGRSCQRPEYIFSYSFGSGLHPHRYRERGRQPRALLRHLLAIAQRPHHP